MRTVDVRAHRKGELSPEQERGSRLPPHRSGDFVCAEKERIRRGLQVRA